MGEENTKCTKNLVIIESNDNNRQDEINKLIKCFEKEMLPLGITCKNWAKPK